MPAHDHAQRRASRRHGREKGCWVYIPAEALQEAGVGTDDPPPLYRTWAGTRGGVLVQLYKRPATA